MAQISRSQSPASAPGTTAPTPPHILAPGDRAPDFDLRTTPDQRVCLSDFRGRPLVIAFYPADWSPVCGDEMTLFNEVLPEFQRLGAEFVGISVDGVWCHVAFARHKGLHFPLLSDFEPKGQVARRYGAYRADDGVAERALFVIRPDGVIHRSYLSPVGVNPGADGALAALEELTGHHATKESPHGDPHHAAAPHAPGQ